jgi:hypothetical protein
MCITVFFRHHRDGDGFPDGADSRNQEDSF